MSSISVDGAAVPALSEIAEVQPFDDGAVILNTRSGQLYSCNHVTLAFLDLVDGERSIAAISALIAEDYEQPVAEVESDLIEVNTELVAEGLVVLK